METAIHNMGKSTYDGAVRTAKSGRSAMKAFGMWVLSFLTMASFQNGYAQCGSVSSNYNLTTNTTCSSLSITGGTYTIGAGVTLTVGSISVQNGTLTISGTGTLIVTGSSGPAMLMGTNSELNTSSGSLIVVGPDGNSASNTAVQFNNNSEVNIVNGATMIVNGSVVNQNNSDEIELGGTFIINGNFTGGNGSEVNNTGGTGVMQTTGTTTLNGSASAMGSTTDCGTGPCSYSSSSCSHTVANPSASSTSIACGGSSTLTCGTVSGGSGTITYQWQRSTATSAWANISGATASSYNATGISQTTNYRVIVRRNSCNRTSNLVKVTVTSGTSTPSLSLSSSSGTTVCSGASVTFTATASNTGGGTVTYTFFKNGNSEQTGSSNTYTTSSLLNGDQISASISISGGSCLSSTQATSSTTTMTVNPTPTVSIDKTAPSSCNGASIVLNASGEPGNALIMSGTNQYIQLNDDPLQTATDFTFEAWIYWTDNSTQWQRIFDFGNNTNVNMFFTPKSSSGYPRYAITVSGNGGEQQINTTTNIPVNTWNHVAITYNSTTDDAFMYLNGTQIGSNTNMTIGPNDLTPRPLAFNYLGESQYVADPNFAGRMDEIRIWNVARSQTEINTYKGSSVPTSSTGLVAYYKLNEGTGSTLVSVTGSSTATVQGGATWGTSGASVSPVSGQTTTYSWSPTTGLSASTGATVTANPSSTTTYTVTGTYTNGCSSTATSTITVTNTSVSISSTATTICAGTSVTFTATPVNAGTPTYQWKRNGTNISGATSATYTTTTLTNGNIITCEMTPTGGCTSPITSSGITMTVNALPTISLQSTAGATYCRNATATAMSVTASGAGISYQWYSNTTASNSGGTLISGANSWSFAPPTTTVGTRYYYCVVTGTCSPAATSAVSGAIVVNARPTVSFTSAPTATTCVNSSVTYTTQSGQNNYVWSVPGTNGVDYSITSGGIGTSSNTVTLTWLTTGSKTVTVNYSNSNGCSAATATSNTTTVYAITSITTQPVGTTICSGTNTSFSVVATGGGTLTYQWRRWGTNIADGGVYSGTNTATLTLTGATVANAGEFSVNVTGACPSSPITSTAAVLVVNEVPTITSQPSFNTSCENGNVSYAVVATGGNLNYQWRENGSDLSNTGVYSGVSTATLTLTGVPVSLNGRNYSVVVSNGCTPNATSSSALLTVVPYVTPSVSISASATTVCSGTSVTFTPSAGNGGASPSYEWKINGGTVATNSGAYTSTSLNNGDVVSCVMTSNSQCLTTPTATSNNVNMSVTQGIANNTIGADETICANTTPATIAPTAVLSGGNGVYTYQWQSSTDNSSFANIGSATSASYTPAATTTTTWYRRVVSSGACESISTAVQKQIQTGVFTWVGNLSSDWGTAGNWCGNAVPTASDNVTINAGTLNSPAISGIVANAADFNMASGATLVMQSMGILNVHGNWSNNGTLVANDGTTVRFAGTTGTQTIGGAAVHTFYNLEKTAASTLIISPTSELVIRRGGLLKVSAGVFDMNGRSVLLKSKVGANGVDSTAALGVVTGTLLNRTGFKIERYNVAVRGVRYISNCVAGATPNMLKDSIIIAGPAAGGFDSPYSSISTIKDYSESRSSSLSKGFVSFTSVNTPLYKGKGYYLYVPAKRTTIFPANEPVTLLFRGSPVMGDVNFNVTYTANATQGWNLVGNPYPSAIDWDNFTAWTKTNMDDAIYVWDPTMGVSGGYYSYVSGISSDARDNGSIISSSQGFFVKANAANPVLTVTENAKVSATYAKSNFRVSQTNSYVTLKVTNQNGDVDYTTIRLEDGSGRVLSALKMLNNKLNMYTKDAASKLYSINAIADAPAYQVPIYIESPSSTSYTVEVVKLVGDINTGNTLKLKDMATGQLMDVAVGTKITYAADGNAQRLSLVKEEASSVVTDIVEEVEVDGGYELYPTHASHSSTPVLYTFDHSGKKIEIYKGDGTLVGHHHTHHATYSFHDFDNYGSGVYTIKVTSNHKVHTFKVVK